MVEKVTKILTKLMSSSVLFKTIFSVH